MSWLRRIWCRFKHQETWVPVDSLAFSYTLTAKKRRYWCHLCGKERTL